MRWFGWGLVALWSAMCLGSPTTRPANLRIGVAPFSAIGPARGQEWMGKAIQRSLIADLSRMEGVRVVEVGSSQPADGVDWVVEGEFQILGPELRITGQVIETASGEVIGGIKTSGGVRDLFALEDAAGMQLKRMVNPPATTTQAPARPDIQTPTDVRLGEYSVRPYAGSALQRAVNGGGVVDRYMERQTYYDRYMLGWPGVGYGYGYYNAPYGPFGYGVPVYGWGWPGFRMGGYWGACRVSGHWRR